MGFGRVIIAAGRVCPRDASAISSRHAPAISATHQRQCQEVQHERAAKTCAGRGGYTVASQLATGCCYFAAAAGAGGSGDAAAARR